MLKKYHGGLTLLIFVFTFVAPSFVGINTTDAHPTRVHRQPYQRDYYCGGILAHSESGTQETTYNFDHPPDTEVNVPVYKVHRDGLPKGSYIPEIIRYERGTVHTSHSVDSTYNSSRIYERINLDRSHWRCR